MLVKNYLNMSTLMEFPLYEIQLLPVQYCAFESVHVVLQDEM
jgi:hypothetical protein